MTPILTPAYGRDYKSKKAVLADLEKDLDFVHHDTAFGVGLYSNLSQLREENIKVINVRYSGLRKVMVVNLERDIPS